MTKFYIYTLSDPETNLIFHVGMGKQYRLKKISPHERYGKCRDWIVELRSNGKKPKVEVLEVSFSKKKALELEIKWIKLLREKGMPLTNQTDGGIGVKGYKFSDELRRRNAEAKIGNTNMLGKRHSNDTKRKIREARKKQIVWNTGLKGIPGHNCKPVMNIKTGVVFETALSAARSIGMNPKTLRGQLTGVYKHKTDFRYVGGQD